jgi:hypothetical protein
VVLDAFDLLGPGGEGAFVGDASGVLALGFGEGFEGVVEFLLEGGSGHGVRLPPKWGDVAILRGRAVGSGGCLWAFGF